MNKVKKDNKNQPLFSVIVPIYNIEKYIEQCIKSIIEQTFEDFELILVNDGSPDHSLEICKTYANKDSRINIVSKQNGGLVSARKAGVEVAKGEYVICVDGDDWITKDYLEKMANIINKNDVDIICCGAIWAYEDKNVEHKIEKFNGYYNRERIIKEIFPHLIEDSNSIYFPSSIWAKTYKRDLYKKNQLLVNNQIKIGEDQACSKCCIYEANSLYISEDCLYYYRQNPYSMTKNKKAFDWKVPMIIANHFKQNLDLNKYDFKEQVDRIITHNVFNVAVSQFYTNKKYIEVKRDIKEKCKELNYYEAIKNCKYSIKNWRGLLAKYSLKYNLAFLMKIYSKII